MGYAYRNGQYCCGGNYEDSNWRSIQKFSRNCCGKSIPCPNGGNCENATPPSCGVFIGGCPDDNECSNSYAKLENRLAEKQHGPDAIVNYRPVYINDNEDCMWFDENGYWRKGDCQYVGTSGNSNTLRISQRDLNCPIIQVITKDGTSRSPA